MNTKVLFTVHTLQGSVHTIFCVHIKLEHYNIKQTYVYFMTLLFEETRKPTHLLLSHCVLLLDILYVLPNVLLCWLQSQTDCLYASCIDSEQTKECVLLCPTLYSYKFICTQCKQLKVYNLWLWITICSRYIYNQFYVCRL